eukprot:SM000070S21367  [mRNA]  locus=s70:635755:638960:- [translate_table: standard]
MRAPVEVDAAAAATPLGAVPGLDTRLAAALRASGVEGLFPVQAATWHEMGSAAMAGQAMAARDLCVCAPTGSGKTLAYALPVLQALSARVVRRLRALVVLPTRDLAVQVKAVFDPLAAAVDLAVGLAIGQTSLGAEGAQLVEAPSPLDGGALLLPLGLCSRADMDAAGAAAPGSRVDILVATPGRLVDHLTETPGFTLEHLLYLVVDETDRLLRQSYQEWLPRVLAAAGDSQLHQDWPPRSLSSLGVIRTVRRWCLERGQRGGRRPRLTKLVLSATLTQDPAKFARLDLHKPLYITASAAERRYKLPSQLREFKLVCRAGEKPLCLLALLHHLPLATTIVFTASVEATHRLFVLLQSFEGLPVRVVEYSSLQHQRARSASLGDFKSGRAHVLVASDAMTRGMDVDDVAHVVSYDAPVYAKTYVHRVGRTARAGKPGTAYTILRKEEVKHFKSLLRKVDNNFCRDYKLPSTAMEELQPRFLTGKLHIDTSSDACGMSESYSLQKLKATVEEESLIINRRH